MPNLGVNATWGRQDWAQYVLDHLGTESVLLRPEHAWCPSRAASRTSRVS